MSGKIKKQYEERLKRVKDSVQLKEPDRVPLVPVMQGFPIIYAGGTYKECMYDWTAVGRCLDIFYRDFKPDLGWDPIFWYPAKYMEEAGLNWFRWPGKHIKEPNVLYQYIEGEYMKGEEYPEAIQDISKFMLNKWIPRSFSKLQGFSALDFRNSMWMGHMNMLAPFGLPEVQKSLKAAMKAGQTLLEWYSYLAEYDKKMEEEFGVPVAYATFAFAPFDMIGDTMRGTVKILFDLYDHPDELFTLIDKVTEFAIPDAIAAAKASGRPWIWMWLHKGVDEFMSDEKFKKFYWPSLRKCITAFADAGCTPMVYVEGKYNTRLHYLTEIPKGKVVYLFEDTDMANAKKILKDTACIAGNVPNTILAFGKKQEVVDYCKWLIDTCAPGGGYMMDTSALLDNAKPENVKAMFETTETYGRRH